jgi:hypothetical protein
MTELYVSILDESNQHQKLLSFLRELRLKGLEHEPFLFTELRLAFYAHNHTQAVEICDLLYHHCPTSAVVAYNRIISYYHANKVLNDFDKTYEIAKNGKLDVECIKNLFNVLLSNERPIQALDLLVEKIQTSNSQSLRDFYYGIHLLPSVNNIIQESKDIAQIGDYITYTDGSTQYNGTIMEEGILSGFIDKGIGAVVTVNNGVNNITFKLQLIQTKYVALLHEVTADIMNNQSRSIRVINFDDIKDDPLTGLQKATEAYRGIDNNSYKRLQEDQINLYKSAQCPLYMVKSINDIGQLYELIFGEFNVHQVPYFFIKSLFANTDSLNDSNIVLDLSALILMHAISQKLGIDNSQKFIISQRVYDYVRENYEYTKRDPMQVLYSPVIRNNLSHLFTKEPQCLISTILANLMTWIDHNCEVVIVEEMVNHQSKDYSPIIETYIESILLAQRPNHILITEDLWLCRSNGGPVTVNTEYYLRTTNSCYNEKISRYYTDLNYIGHCIDGSYIIEQILLKERDQTNGFIHCLELVKANPYIVSSYLYALVPFLSGIITGQRIRYAEQVFYTMFASLGYQQAKHVYSKISTFQLPSLVKKIINNAFNNLEGEQIIILPPSK